MKKILFNSRHLSLQNFNTTSFGLSSVEIHKVSRLKETHQQQEKLPIPLNPGRRLKYGYLKHTAIALIAVSLVSLGGMKMYEDEVQKYNFAEKQKAVTALENTNTNKPRLVSKIHYQH